MLYSYVGIQFQWVYKMYYRVHLSLPLYHYTFVCAIREVNGSHLTSSQKCMHLWMEHVGGYMEGDVGGACHSTIATGKTTSLLDVLAQQDVELYTYLCWPIISDL